MRNLSAALAAAAVVSMLLAAPAGAASGPTALPTVKRSLSAAASVRRACPAAPARTARGVAVSAYRAPITGFATVRMAGSDRSDWDLVVRDAASGRVLSASQGFGSHEVAQSWVAAGQRLLVQGCRRKGAARSVPVSIALVVATPPKSPGTPSLIRVYGNDRAKLAKL